MLLSCVKIGGLTLIYLLLTPYDDTFDVSQ